MPIMVTITDESGSGGTFSGLVTPDGAVPAPQGFAMPAPRRLDEVLDLSPDTDIRFIRLDQLAGG